MTSLNQQTETVAERKKSLSLIDCDVHNAHADVSHVTQYMSRYFQERGISLPGGEGNPSPVGVGRQDAIPPQGGRPGSCPDTMRRQLLDAYNIDYAILTGSGILGLGTHPDLDYAAELANAYNQWMHDYWLHADPRFRGSIIVPPQYPQAAVKQIHKYGDDPRVVQVLMNSATRIPLGDRTYWPIYEAACEHGLPVAVHPGAEGRGISNTFAPGHPASYFAWHTNLSQNYMGQVSSLICRGVFCEFPQMKFVCVEGGIGWAPHLMWRLDKNWKALRSSTPWLERPPSEYLVEHVRFTTQPIEEPPRNEQLLQIFEMVQAEKTVMFSSDYPHWDNDSPVHGIPRLPDDLKQRILVENARELYNLPDEPPALNA